MSKKKPLPEFIDFWKNNRKDQHFTLPVAEVKEKFLAFCKLKGRAHLEYYMTYHVFCHFVGTPESEGGLQSVHDSKVIDDEVIFELFSDDFWKLHSELSLIESQNKNQEL